MGFLYETLADVTPGPTMACWSVGDLQAEVSGLQTREVELVENDLPGATKQGVVAQLVWRISPDLSGHNPLILRQAQDERIFPVRDEPVEP